MSFVSPNGKMVAVGGRKDIRTYDIEFEEDKTFSGSETHIYLMMDLWTRSVFNTRGEALNKGRIEGQTEPVSDQGEGSEPDYYELDRDDSVSDQGASVSYVNRTFFEQVPDGISTSVTIEEDGTLIGSDSTGCTLTGV